MLVANVVNAQDDDLPPPTSNPKSEQSNKPDENFQGFKPKKKVDLSKFIIEPNFNFFISQSTITLGLSPYVGYKVFEPKKVKGNAGNVGLFVGGGVTYFYTRVTEPGFYPNSVVRYDIQTYGGGPFIQYNIWKGFFVRTKVELLGRKIPVSYDVITQPGGGYTYRVNYIRKFTPSALVGVGYNLLQSKNFFFPIVISYNVLHPFTTESQRAYSVYPRGLVIQLGFVNVF